MRLPLIVPAVALALAMSLCQGTWGMSKVKLSPTERVGKQAVRIAYVETGLEWLIEQRYFLVDGRKYNLPPASLYDRVFSAPRWTQKNKKINGLLFWQFKLTKDGKGKEVPYQRAVHAAFPSYKILASTEWEVHEAGDTVPDPPTMAVFAKAKKAGRLKRVKN